MIQKINAMIAEVSSAQANNAEEAYSIINNDDNHTGEIIEVREVKQ